MNPPSSVRAAINKRRACRLALGVIFIVLSGSALHIRTTYFSSTNPVFPVPPAHLRHEQFYGGNFTRDPSSQDTPGAHTKGITAAQNQGTPSVQTKGITVAEKQGTPAVQSQDITEAQAQGTPAVQSQDITATQNQGTPAVQSQDITKAQAQGTPAVQSQDIIATQNQGTPAVQSQDITATQNQGTPAVQSQDITATQNQGTPAVQSQDITATQNQGTPVVQNQTTPATLNQGTPAAQNQGTPVVQNQTTPATLNQGTPAAQNQGTPVVQTQTTPATLNQGTPAAQNQGTPVVQNQTTPATLNQGTPAAQNQGTPVVQNQATPATLNQGTPGAQNQGTPAAQNQGTHVTHKLGIPAVQSQAPAATPIHCEKLWRGDVEEQARAESSPLNRAGTERRRGSSEEWEEATRDCAEYRRREGYDAVTISQQELDFPLAFSLLVYRDADQVERLLRAIYRPHNAYCLHVDAKSNDSYRHQVTLVASCLPNVFLSNVSVDVQWGQFTNLEPEIICMRQLWDHAVRWRYFINLTGQEFPLKTNRELVEILVAFKGANDIIGASNLPIYYPRWSHALPAPGNLTVYKGAVHIVACRGFVKYVLFSPVAHALLAWVNQTQNPDESFFNTLNHNPQLGVPGSAAREVNTGRDHRFTRYKMWVEEPVHPCSGVFVRTVCHLGVGDLPRLAASPFLFANKLSYDYQPLAYSCLEAWHLNKVRLERDGKATPLNLTLYAESQLVRDRYTGPVKIWA